MPKEKKTTPEEALEVLKKEEEKKEKAFIKDYEALCEKHGLKIIPLVNLAISKIKN
jgi:hypothetical protein